MKTRISLMTVLAAGFMTLVAATIPGAPEDHGLTPRTGTIYVNRKTPSINHINNGSTENLGVAIATGGNVMVGWEDDGEGLEDAGAVWTLFDATMVQLTPDTECSSLALGGSVTNRFLSYFRADGSAVYGGTSWGPKIKANLFGEGLGMGASSFALGLEVAEFASWDDSRSGDVPSVQMLNHAGQPVGLVPGVAAEYALRDPGNIRIADWDYLSNGNLVIVGESRQTQDLVDLYGGEAPAYHALFRIMTPGGAVVKTETLVSETPVTSEMWHGVGVTANGFGVRFSGPGGATVRLFDNAGNPTSGNIDLATLTGSAQAGGGGRGDSTGFHGNGRDRYVVVSGSGTEVWLTVLNADSSLHYSRSVADDLEWLGSVGRTDAAIDPNGSVIVVFSGRFNPDYSPLVMGRRFAADGTPAGGTFHVSEKERPDGTAFECGGPRIAWRTGQVAVVWESLNDRETVYPETSIPMPVVALRLFSTVVPNSAESVGLTRLVPDTPVVRLAVAAKNNWEPYTSVLGTGTFLIEANTFAQDSAEYQRYVVALQPADGGPMKLGEGFHADDGQPYRGQINLSRQDGNPGRVAGDARPGAVNFIVGGETSVHGLPEFQSDDRWYLGFSRPSEARYGTVQTYALDPATLVTTPLGKAQDAAFGRLTSGVAADNQVSRFGGDMAALDDGNFVAVVDDRSHVFSAADCVTAAIFGPDGAIVKDSWVIAPGDIWANVAPCRDGFVVRCQPPDGSDARLLYCFDNAGNLKGTIEQAASGVSFDTGRGDGTRVFGHVNSPFVFLVGQAADTQLVKVAAFDTSTRQFVAAFDVNAGAFSANLEGAHGAADALNRLTVAWVSQPTGYAKPQVVSRVLAFDGAGFVPLTPCFFPFLNTATNDIRSVKMSVAMTTRQICVAAKGEINYANLPERGPDSPTQVSFYTVFTHPAPAEDPTPPVGGATATLLVTKGPGNSLTISWTPSSTPGRLYSTPSLSAPVWTKVGTGTQNPSTVIVGAGSQFYQLR